MSDVASTVIWHDGRILFIRRDESDWGGGKWDLPGGGVDEGETPLETAEREIFEETGLKVKNLKTFWKRPKRHGSHWFFQAEASHPGVSLSDEHDRYIWIEPHTIHPYHSDFLPRVRDCLILVQRLLCEDDNNEYVI